MEKSFQLIEKHTCKRERPKVFHGDKDLKLFMGTNFFWANMWAAETNDQIMPGGLLHKCIFQ